MKKSDYLPRTDFADEIVIKQAKNAHFERQEKAMPNMKMNWIKVLEDENELKKKKGDYITLEFKKMDDALYRDGISEEVVSILDTLSEDYVINKYLVVGLGNVEMISDAIGPKTAQQILVTAHLFEMNEDLGEGIHNCASLVPKVMGQTGLESSRIVKGVVDFYRPDLVIVVDALATNDLGRINRAVQISNTGITPGSGVGNHREAIDEESLKVPVISIGVATVTTIGAIIHEVLDETRELTHDALDMIVTPRSMDHECEEIVQILAKAINCFIHPDYESM